jgi:uncharacterized protein (TIGR03086 family)
MDQVTQYTRAAAAFRTVLAGVGADQLGAKCPCDGWDVAALLDHTYGAQRQLTAGIGGTVVEADDFEAIAAAAQSAMEAPGALAVEVESPFGKVPAGFLAGLAVSDLFVHAWDLAKAVGANTDLDAELAELLLADAKARISPAMRGEGKAFGPEQPVPADAPAADRLAGFMGRTV